MSDKSNTRPAILAGYVIIFLTFGVLGSWAAVAKLDSAVVAPATIMVEGNRKVIQHFEGGIVDKILVKEAEHVDQGDILLELNSVEARSNVDVLTTRLNVARLVEARLLAERGLAEAPVIPDDILKQTDIPAIETALADQIRLFEDRKSIVKSQTDILAKRIDQTHVQIEGLELQRSALERRIENYTQMLERMRKGQTRGLIQSNLVSQREDDLIQIEADLGQIISQTAQSRNVIGETELQSLQVMQEYQERANDELEEIRAEISELRERRKVAQDILHRTRIRAPGSGTIQNLKVHTVGSVVQPGEIMMELVPEGEQLVINARVSPIDKDNVVPGLSTEIRFTAFKARLTPIMLGKVEFVSNDVITSENPNDPPYYMARINVNKLDIPEEIQGRLTAGMPADVVITTGERTVAHYLAAPLVDAVRVSLIEE